ncbi:MAG: 4Fe-4S dicluster domain-containing protein [Defluviitaleaceae bacterium]|nr:4Fe-4S dicluster domain-containing protein [Defluviitaleaceae bacterium]
MTKKMTKKINIDSQKCIGCGVCVTACAGGAIGMKDGKAYLLQEDYCDGLGRCLPVCPTGAITFENAAENATKITAAEEPTFSQWPIQLKLLPINAPYFDNAKLLIAADCSAYTYKRFRADFMQGRIIMIGCPKLDDIDYSEKLTKILQSNNIKSVIITRMEVPCCSGIEIAAKKALQNCNKAIPWQVVTISTNGNIIES